MQIMTDSPIRFPGLFGDWAFTASSKALDIGNGIYWYGILIALGLVIAIWWCMNQKSKYGITEDDLLDSVLWGIPCAIVGARIYYVLFYLDQFKTATAASASARPLPSGTAALPSTAPSSPWSSWASASAVTGAISWVPCLTLR